MAQRKCISGNAKYICECCCHKCRHYSGLRTQSCDFVLLYHVQYKNMCCRKIFTLSKFLIYNWWRVVALGGSRIFSDHNVCCCCRTNNGYFIAFNILKIKWNEKLFAMSQQLIFFFLLALIVFKNLRDLNVFPSKKKHK